MSVPEARKPFVVYTRPYLYPFWNMLSPSGHLIYRRTLTPFSRPYVQRRASNTLFLDSLRRSASARNVSSRISLRWPIHIINPVDKTKLCYLLTDSDNNNHNKFTYNAGSDWLEQGALSENREHVDGFQVANLNIHCKKDKHSVNKLLARRKYGSRRPPISLNKT